MVDYLSSKKKIDIITEIKEWSASVLEVTSDHFNGLPPCPYAKAAWINNRVKFDFGDKDIVLDHIQGWDDSCDLLIVIAEDWAFEEIEDWCEAKNDEIRKDDIVLMPFVPGEGPDTGQPEEEATNWEYLVDEPYSMIFIQRLSKVNKASESLEKQGYYKNCTAEFLEYVHNRRKGISNARQIKENEESTLKEKINPQGEQKVHGNEESK
tara:strand:+ start:2993 stop:3619 length:627 start_codon:yes stop_codon:yes gene_type:complete